MKKKIPESILVGYIYDEISPHNKAKVEKLLREDEGLRKEIDDLLHVRSYLKEAGELDEIEVGFKFKKPRKRESITFYRWAATILLILSVLLFLSGFEFNYSKDTFSFKFTPFWAKSKKVDSEYLVQNLKKYIDEKNFENRKELNDALFRIYSKIESERMADKVMFKENIIQMRDLLLNVVDNSGSLNALYLKSKYKTYRRNPLSGGN